jgi:hypothetical protein
LAQATPLPGIFIALACSQAKLKAIVGDAATVLAAKWAWVGLGETLGDSEREIRLATARLRL